MEKARMFNNVGKFLARLMKPLMNERGEAGSDPPPEDGIARDENGFIPGTSYKTLDDLVKGHGELKSKFDSQGNELGTIKKDHEKLKGQSEILATTLRDVLATNKKQEKAGGDKAGADQDKEIADAQSALEKLDPMADDFPKKQAALVTKITDLKAEKVKTAVLSEAGKLFQNELQQRDVKSAQGKFIEQNPTFNMPEIQSRIADFLAKDATGMHDKMSAFFALQAADEAAERARLTEENEGFKKVLKLQEGKDKTGKVIVKGQSPQNTTGNQKVTGKDLDEGMKGILQKMRGE